MPNSLIQGMTTETTAQLHRLSPFSITVLLGLLSLVDSNQPKIEVETEPSTLLDIIGVGKTVAHAVDRIWETKEGTSRQQRYETRRFNPKTLRDVHATLLELHNCSVVVRRHTPKGREERTVHLLDSFGYSYTRKGKMIDLDDLPGERKRNVGSADRPVWKLCKGKSGAKETERPSGILFRLNSELADELAGVKGTIHFTLVAHRVFDLLRQFRKDAVAIRLLLLVLRQTAAEFHRHLTPLLAGLGLDSEHRQRAIDRAKQALGKLQAAGVIDRFSVDEKKDRVDIVRTVDRGGTAAD